MNSTTTTLSNYLAGAWLADSNSQLIVDVNPSDEQQILAGLSVSLFTRDIDAMLNYIQHIACGMVRINADTTGVDPHAPFGGMKSSSSHSREQGTAAIEFFTEMKTVQINPAGV